MATMTESHSNHSFLPWIVWAVAASYFFFDYLQQMAPGVMGPDLLQSFNVSAVALGTLSAFYFYSYSVMQIPVGVITDRFGPHRPLIIAACVAAGGSILFAKSGTLHSAEIARMIIGAGTAFAYVACLKLVSNWFPSSRFATLVGLTSLVGMMGAIFGDRPLAASVTHFGWQSTSMILAAIGGGLAILIWLFVRDHPPGAVRWEEHPEHERGKAKIRQDIRHVFSNPRAWQYGVYITTMNITFTALGATWGVSFIQKAYNVSEVSAAQMVAGLFWGGLVGGLFWGWLSDRIRRRKLPMILSAAGALVGMVIILYAPGIPQLSQSALYVLLILEGFCCNGLVLGYSVSNDIRPPGSAGISAGFANTITAGGTSIFLPIIGRLSALKNPIAAAQGLSALLVGDFRFALTFLIGALVVALLVALFARETRCQLLYDKD